jgi:hypothetical protein
MTAMLCQTAVVQVLVGQVLAGSAEGLWAAQGTYRVALILSLPRLSGVGCFVLRVQAGAVKLVLHPAPAVALVFLAQEAAFLQVAKAVQAQTARRQAVEFLGEVAAVAAVQRLRPVVSVVLSSNGYKVKEQT